jgi:hypothetical protein
VAVVTVDQIQDLRGAVVPFITRWSSEHLSSAVIGNPSWGIAYEDETRWDRNAQGVLWERAPLGRGKGRPEFAGVHPLRQRRAMRKLLCQVCGGPADRTKQGELWLLPDHRDDWPGWPDEMANVSPPVCLPCARLSVRMCPVLRRSWVAIRAKSRIVGVQGIVYQLDEIGLRPLESRTVRFDEPEIRLTLAGQLVRMLHDSVFIDLDAHQESAVTSSAAIGP